MDLRRFDRLHVKLFLAIAGVIAGLTLVTYLVFTWTFERGFVQYVNRADEARLELMTDRLAAGYAREGGWSWIVGDQARWTAMSRDALGLPASGEAGGRRELPLTIDPRLLLFDGGRALLIGRPEMAPGAVLQPIVSGDRVVGYLGSVPRIARLQSLERVYLRRQYSAFAAVAFGMVLAAVVLAAGLTYWLTRRVRALVHATNALIRGDYAIRLAPRGHDELAQLAADFNTLAETLAAAQTARQHWIADIAHELRTPLSILRGEIESLQDGVRPLNQDNVASLAHETARLSRLVEDLHTLSLSDLGALTYYREPVDLADVITDAVSAQRRQADERGLAVTLDLEEDTIVLADETRLAQVFANLMQNSLRYTDSPGSISVALKRERGRAVVEWHDSAPGVDAEDLPRLTERLYRVEASRNRAGGGSGLGLAIARAIVEGHGGTLTATPSPLGGLGIRLVFPRRTGASRG
ncbi:MAG TPA: ATP-binding protein [Candidatus Acidoferrum sp.]|nr:ATP-binding protein [Candidatus Acidoferrum sp.]